MAVHYAISGQRALITAAANVFEFPVPTPCSLSRLGLRISSANGSGDAVFEVRVNGATIYADPLDRPKILLGETTGEVLPAEALVAGDLVAVDLVTVPAGGLSGLYVTIDLDDELSLVNAVSIQGVNIDATPPTEGQVLVFDGTDWIPGAPPALYAVYVALLTQVTTGDPSAGELQNSIGAIVWTRDDVGVYIGTLAAAFPTDRTVVIITPSTALTLIAATVDASEDFLTLTVQDASAAFVPFDDALLNTMIEIRVYPVVIPPD